MKKILSIVLALSIMGAMLAGCESAKVNETGESEKAEGYAEQKNDVKDLVIRTNTTNVETSNNQLLLAVATGLWDEEFGEDNITLDFSDIGGGPQMNEAMIAGELDIETAIGDQPMITGISGGTNGVALSCLARQTYTEGVYALTSSGIKSVADLKGKNIGVGIGRFTHKCLVGVLEDEGISEDEVNLINFTGDFMAAYASLESGDLDAIVSDYVSTYDSINDGSVVQIIDFTSHPAYDYIVFHRDFVEKYPDVTQRILNVLVRVQKYEEKNPQEVARLISEKTGYNYDAILDLRSKIDLTIDLTDKDIEEIEWTYNFLKSHDYLTADIDDISVIYDTAYVKKAIETVNNEQQLPDAAEK